MKLFLGFIVACFTLCMIGLSGAFIYGYIAWSASGPLTESRNIVIEKGSGVSGIAATLDKEGVIKSPLVFKIAALLSGDQGALKAGEYEFTPSISMRAVLYKLAQGDIVQRRITIPEGRTSWQIVQIVNAAGGMTGAVHDIPKEGSLLPETYSFTRDADRNGIISDMGKAMENTIAELWPDRAEGLPFDTPDQAITLASVVEKETGVASERTRIAGVFINRLKRGMPLQSDPTVIYALTGGVVKEDGMGPLGRRLLRKDMGETESPYNTYKYPGLPPGPIANPGRAAIEAVLHPEQNDYLYFVADGKGGHVFAATLAEHERNAAEWRQIRKEQGN
jgi:UPF0755 protein